MRRMVFAAAIAIAAGAAVSAQAAPMSGNTRIETGTPLLLVQDKKAETTTQKVKRVWKGLVGYKFNVSCLLSQTRTCTETGKSRDAARAKCQSAHPLCVVNDAK